MRLIILIRACVAGERFCRPLRGLQPFFHSLIPGSLRSPGATTLSRAVRAWVQDFQVVAEKRMFSLMKVERILARYAR